MNTTTDLARAYHFAAVRHTNQRRKGKAGEPYINHLTEVAELVAGATGGEDLDLIIAAVLHDTIEDTGTTRAELEREFGPNVAGWVSEVTDDKTLSKGDRKRLQVEHAPHLTWGAKIIKLADKTANLHSLKKSPPEKWPADQVADYLNWSKKVVAGIRGTNAWLEERFDEAVGEFDVR
jgi:(p)ppGpp synthase/HD superfamily hydrolase